MSGPAILLFRGRGIISALIRWQSRGDVSHAALLCPDGQTIIESWPGKGVQQKVLKDWEGVEAYSVNGMRPEQWREALEWAYAQIGCGYDYLGVARFISRSPRDDKSRWFCSELVFAALEAAGVWVLERIEAYEVAPAHLRISPLLTPQR